MTENGRISPEHVVLPPYEVRMSNDQLLRLDRHIEALKQDTGTLTGLLYPNAAEAKIKTKMANGILKDAEEIVNNNRHIQHGILERALSGLPTLVAYDQTEGILLFEGISPPRNDANMHALTDLLKCLFPVNGRSQRMDEKVANKRKREHALEALREGRSFVLNHEPVDAIRKFIVSKYKK